MDPHLQKWFLKVTEFPDPEGKATYFRLDDLSVGVPDELLSGSGDRT